METKMTLTEAEARIGQHIRSNHPYAYRSGEWATVVGAEQWADRVVFKLHWPDGTTDAWPVDDPAMGYEFQDAFAAVRTASEALEALGRITEAIRRDAKTPGVRAPRVLRGELIAILKDWSDRADT